MTTVDLFANLAQTAVTSGGTTAPASGTTESWVPAAPAAFPTANPTANPPTVFRVTDPAAPSERITVTDSRTGTWTVTRGDEGTATVAHAAGFTIEAVVTAAALGKFAQAPGGVMSSQLTVPDLAVTGLPGAVAGSRYAGATTAGAPASGTFAAGDWVVDQTGKIWICTAGGTPGTWTQAGSALDTTAADILPIGSRAAGSTGKGADAGHVHPYQPWQFIPESYGAKGDVIVVSDANITAGTNALSFTSSAPLTSTAVDGGKVVYVVGAGAAGADFVTTISAVTDSGHATLAANAGTTVTSKGCVFATDDTSAILQAYQAAHAYALASAGRRAQVLFSKLYGVAGAPAIGGATKGNAQIPLTIVTASTTAKIRIEFAGVADDAAELVHWLQPAPQISGPGLVCLRLDGTNDAFNGPACVIGGPVNGYGAAASLFSNMQVTLSNFRIHVPCNSTYAGADLFGTAECRSRGFACQAMGIAPSGGAWPQLNQASITNQYTFGLRTPDTNNNDRCDISQYSCEGLCYGLMPSEHATWDSVRAVYCIIGCELFAGSGMPHGVRGEVLSAEACAWAVGVLNSAPLNNSVKAVIAQADMEIPGQQLLFDTGNLFAGSIGALGNYTPGYGVITVNGAHGARICDLMQIPGALASPQAPPASTGVWINAYYSDAWVTLRVSGGTLSSLTLYGPQGSGAGVVQAAAAGAAVYNFFLPAGCAYKPAYTGTLAHDITLRGGN